MSKKKNNDGEYGASWVIPCEAYDEYAHYVCILLQALYRGYQARNSFDYMIEKRIQGLNRFMSRCLRSPFLKGDPSFAHFLSSAYNASSKWDTLKNTATSQSALPFLVRPVIDQYRTYGTELASGDGAGEDEK